MPHHDHGSPDGEPVALTPAECLTLLETDTVGRIAYTDHALPAITPVNYVVDGHSIVIRTREDGRLAGAVADSVVAFEVDSLDRGTRTGWSVVVIGDCHRLTEPGDIVRAHGLGLSPWAGGTRNAFLRITTGIITGRRLCGDANCAVCTTARQNGHVPYDGHSEATPQP